MNNPLDEIRRNLHKVGQFDLASALEPEDIPARKVSKALEYSRILVAINGSQSAFITEVRVEILARLWGYVTNRDDGERLRVCILIAIERLAREHPDMESIHGELLVLAAAHEVSYGRSYDLHELSRLVRRADFIGLAKVLFGLRPGTKSYAQVFGRAYQYHKTGNMDGIAYDQVLLELDYYG